jgi:hypothetical protein
MSEQGRKDAPRRPRRSDGTFAKHAAPSQAEKLAAAGGAAQPKQFSLGVADFVETESFAQAEPARAGRRPGGVGAPSAGAAATRASSAGAASAGGFAADSSAASGSRGRGRVAGASSAGAASGDAASATAEQADRFAAGAAAAGEVSLSPTRQRLLREETHPQMVVVRVLEDAQWAQGRLRKEVLEAESDTARLNSLKLFWGIRTEAVKVLQGLGVLPRELFFAEEENDFDHLPTDVAETIAGLLAGRLEPQPTADGDDAA